MGGKPVKLNPSIDTSLKLDVASIAFFLFILCLYL